MRVRLKYFLTFFLLATLLGACLYNFYFLEIISSVVSIFAVATSFHIKTAGFLIYAATCFLVLAFFQRIKIKEKALRIFLVFLIVFFVGVGIVSHVVFLKQYSLPFDHKTEYFVSNLGVNDATTFRHMHTMKPVLYLWIDSLGVKNYFGKVDYSTFSQGALFVGAGYPFLDLFPRWFYFFSAGLYFCLIVCFLLMMIAKEKQWGQAKVASFCIYIVCSFSLLSNVVDGGFATTEFVFAAISLFLILRFKEGMGIREYKKELFVSSFLFLVFLWYRVFIDAVALEKILWLFILYGVLFSFCFISKKKAVMFLFLVVIFAGGLFFNRGYVLKNDKIFYNALLPKNRDIWVTTVGRELPLDLVSKQGTVRLYRTILEQEETCKEFCDQYKLDYRPYFDPVRTVSSSKENLMNFSCREGFLKFNKKGEKERFLNIDRGFWKLSLQKEEDSYYDYRFVFCFDRRTALMNYQVLQALVRESFQLEKFVIAVQPLSKGSFLK